MGRTINEILKTDFALLPTKPSCHAHLKVPLTGIALTDAWLKLPINETDFFVDALCGFTFDEANNRFIWDAADAFSMSLQTLFVGDAGIEVTAGGIVDVILGLFVDGVLILETELDFDNQNKIQSYGANDLMINDVTKVPLLDQGSYVEVFARAGTAQTPTVTLVYFNITVFDR